jgi:hypothetical protein
VSDSPEPAGATAAPIPVVAGRLPLPDIATRNRARGANRTVQQNTDGKQRLHQQTSAVPYRGVAPAPIYNDSLS